MPRVVRTLPLPRPASPAQRWVLWVLVQALLALTLAAGPRAIGGPLHWHEGAADPASHHGAATALARHAHEDAAGAVVLDQAAEGLASHAGASAVATLWPLQPTGLAVPRPGRDRWAAPAAAATWQDADTAAPEHRPRA